MKKILPYLLLGIIAIAAIILAITDRSEKSRKLDDRVTFRIKDKIPYGTFVAYENLKYLFPKAAISINDKEPGYWDSLSNYESDQALVIVAPTFYADEYDMKKIIRFAENGNDVFVSTAIVSEDVKSILNCAISYLDVYDLLTNRPIHTDTMDLSLSNPPFHRTYNYSYPGRRLSAYFHEIDTAIATVLGRDDQGNPNFIHLKAGQGNLYFHLAPAAFSNYFLLRGRNINYYEDMMSLISPTKNRVVWDEYFLYKKYYLKRSGRGGSGSDSGSSSGDNEDSGGWLSSLFSYPALKWALIVIIVTLLLYTLLEMRRKQRIIPVITKPRNDSLDFVRTIGRLYYDKGDHKNLCRKMAAYFLEHVRNRYKLKTTELNDEFISNLQNKTGIDEREIRNIVSFIRDMEGTPALSDYQLQYFHKQLESFYNKA